MKKKKKIKLYLTLGITMIFTMCTNLLCVYANESSMKGQNITSIESRIDELVTPYMEDTMQGMAIAVVKDDQIVYMKGYGYSNKVENTKVDAKSTLFEYGSISKLFIWVSAMQLVEQNKLDLNEDVRIYLPESLQKKLKYKVTMLDLMNHTAGFDDYIIGLFNRPNHMIQFQTWLEDTDVRQYMIPGKESVYSNYGAALAGYIIERISGMKYRDYVSKNIYNPAGIHNLYPESILPNEAKNKKSKLYKKVGEKFKEADATYISAYPAGAFNGTVEELANFSIALLQDHSPLFFQDKTRNQLFETSWLPPNGVEGMGISHGFFQYPSNQLVLWHNGKTFNSNSFLMLVPKEKLAVCILSNTGGEDVLTAERNIAFSLVEKWKTTELKNNFDLKSVEGYYQSLKRCHHGFTKLIYALTPYEKKITVNADGTITIADEVYKQVLPYAFYCEKSGRTFCFSEDENGKIMGGYQLVTYKKMSTLKVALQYVKFVLLILGLCIMIIYAIKNRGWYFITLLLQFMLIANNVILIIRACQLNYFRELSIHILLNIMITAFLLFMLFIHTKREPKRKVFIFDGVVILWLLILGTYGIYNMMG